MAIPSTTKLNGTRFTMILPLYRFDSFLPWCNFHKFSLDSLFLFLIRVKMKNKKKRKNKLINRIHIEKKIYIYSIYLYIRYYYTPKININIERYQKVGKIFHLFLKSKIRGIVYSREFLQDIFAYPSYMTD